MCEIRDDLILDEGFRLRVYVDTAGNPTVGIGHLVLPEDNLKVGDIISHDKAIEFFNKDLSIAIKAAENVIGRDAYSVLTGKRKRALINMAFNLGQTRLARSKRMVAAIRVGDFLSAGRELLDSQAARQLPKRYNRLYKLMVEE